MTPERWQRIEHLYHAALERDANERAAFLAEACTGDNALRREVESLLLCDARAENFIESPALEIAAQLRAEERAQSMIGRQLGHYKILSLLGMGGMGEVYLAEDTKLDRKVALKLLPAEVTQDSGRLRRFVQEAKAASALNHPNIITIHEVGVADGVHFIVTEFIDGQTLRRQMEGSRLKLNAALDIAAQIASALNATHSAGIVHRDIKPENVMVRRDGLVKVLDFGLAKLTERPAASVDTEAATMIKANTDPGTVLGTPQYMSPEQARGLEVDARSDIFSLGVTLYEMVAGQPAFAGATASDVIVAILDREPAMLAQRAPDVPHELERIVSKALRKDREERYQTVKDLLLDLKSLKQELEVADFRSRSADSGNGSSKSATESSATSSAKYLVNSVRQHKIVSAVVSLMLMALVGFVLWLWVGHGGEKAIDSIVILPFDNVGADPNTEYLSDGIPETLINSLAQLPNLRVIPRSTAFSFKKTDLLPHKIGRQLGVRAVLTGKVTQRGDSLIIQADLIDVERDSTMWGDRYDRKIADILAVQEEISQEVAEKLRLRLSSEEREQLTKRSPRNTEAFHLYLIGLNYWNENTEDSVKKAIGSQ
jgi:serine/threonine protein kinase